MSTLADAPDPGQPPGRYTFPLPGPPRHKTMLSYRHAFHAGNFADVVKHTVLALCLDYLVRKPKPLLYLDTHAGRGRYDLQGHSARQSAEAAGGIHLLWGLKNPPARLTPYLDALHHLNPKGHLRYYPGSPWLAGHLLRPMDSLLLYERHSVDQTALSALFSGDRRVGVFREDGLSALLARLPPPERRGLVLIDPSYEVKDEFEAVCTTLRQGYRRFPTGVFLIWYPLVASSPIQSFLRDIRGLGLPKTLLAELHREPAHLGIGMTGCGLILVNPPWPIAAELEVLLPWLAARLGRTNAGHRLEWLVGEQ